MNTPEAKRGPGSLTRLHRIVALCDAFEADWLAGCRPAIEPLLRDVSEADRSRLLRELLALELEYRAARGEAPIAAEYLSRFPGEGTLIDELLADPESTASFQNASDPHANANAKLPTEPMAPPRDGRFRIVHAHARGGLGEVFVAIDTELNREVALKEIRAEQADDDESRNRFLVEAEVTGQLEHPGIVPVYSLGKRSDGRPYYAMRFIRGKSLKEAIDQFHARTDLSPAARSLALAGLLRRFLSVCYAIEYAHARRVVHRDLKPANIMLGDYGESLVVDWGLAKPLGEAAPDAPRSIRLCPIVPMSPSGEGSTPTLAGQVIGTPAFMSPEQASGGEIGPASDVYSLGATLFAILTGRAPVRGTTALEVVEKVRRGEVELPRASQPKLDRALEAICLKALALRPEDRYATARSLAEDLERWLADERVDAYREPWTRTLTRWLTRHRTSVTGAAAAGIATLIGLGVVSTVQTKARNDLDRKNTELIAANTNLEKQRKRAEDNETDAINAVKKFREAVANNAVLQGSPTLAPLRKTLLKEPLVFFRGLRERLRAESDTRPEALKRLADAAFDLGRLSDQIGDKEDSLQAYREALEVLERLTQEAPGVLEYLSDLAWCRHNIGWLLEQTGNPTEAMAEFERARDLREGLVRDHPANADFRRALARSHNALGVKHERMDHWDQALAEYEAARSIQEDLVRDGVVDESRTDLGNSLNNIGILLGQLGRKAEALESHRRALAVREDAAREAPSDLHRRSDVALSHHNIGRLLEITGDPSGALESYQRAIEVSEEVAQQAPSVIRFQSDLALTHNNIGLLLRAKGWTDEALKALDRAREVRERIARDNPKALQLQSDVAASHTNIGVLFQDLGRATDAIESYERARAIRERLARERPDSSEFASDLGAVLNNLATLHLDAKRLEEALDGLREAISHQRSALAANPRNPVYRQFLKNHLTNYRDAAKSLGDDEQADWAERGLEELQSSDPRRVALGARLDEVLKGGPTKDKAERVALARHAYDTARFVSAARLWNEALQDDPKLGEDRRAQIRYDAACAAALAAAGQGKDDPPNDATRSELRSRALTWLKEELAAWMGHLEARPSEKGTVAQTLNHWQADTDLAGVRDPEALGRLPEDERERWKDLWTAVGRALEP